MPRQKGRNCVTGDQIEDIVQWLKYYSQQNPARLEASPRDPRSIWRLVGERVYRTSEYQAGFAVYTLYKQNRHKIRDLLDESEHSGPPDGDEDNLIAECFCGRQDDPQNRTPDLMECDGCQAWYHGHCHGVDDVALFKDTLWFCGTCSGKNVGVPSVLEVNARGKVVLRAAIPAEARPYANPAAAKTSNSSPRNAPWDSPNREDNGRMFDYPESWENDFLLSADDTAYDDISTNRDKNLQAKSDNQNLDEGNLAAIRKMKIRRSDSDESLLQDDECLLVRDRDYTSVEGGDESADAADDGYEVGDGGGEKDEKVAKCHGRQPLNEDESPFLRGFDIEVDYNAWVKMRPIAPNLFLQKGWTDLLASKFQERIYSCVLSFAGHKVRREESVGRPIGNGVYSAYVTATARCSKSLCPASYTFRLRHVPWNRDVPVVFNVRYDGKDPPSHDPLEKRGRFIAGDRRQNIRDWTLREKPSVVKGKMLQQADRRAVKSRNTTDYPSSDVLRQIGSEAQRGEFKGDVWGEVAKLKRSLDIQLKGNFFDGYVHMLGSVPVKVSMVLECALVLLMELLKENPKMPLFFDSTGQAVRRLIEELKPLYFAVTGHYALTKSIVPFAEFVGGKGALHAGAIQEFLSIFLEKYELVRKHHKAPLPLRWEMDFSRPIIAGVIRAYDRNATMSTHLYNCYVDLVDDVRKTRSPTLHVCSWHAIRFLKEQVASHYKNVIAEKKDLVFITLESWSRAFLGGRSKDSFVNRLRQILILVGTSTKNDDVVEAFQGIARRTTTTDIKLPQYSPPDSDRMPIYKASPFGRYAEDLCRDLNIPLSAKGGKSDGTNPFYNPSFLFYLMQDIIPYYPLLSKIMLQLRGFSTHVTSNYAAEGWFGILKEQEKQLKIPLPLFIKRQSEIVQRRIGELDHLRKEKLEELEVGVETLVVRKNERSRPIKKAVAPHQRVPKRNPWNFQENLFSSAEIQETDRTTARKKGNNNTSGTDDKEPTAKEEQWKPHRYITRPPNTYMSIFQSIPLIPWGGRTSIGDLTNTCPMDNGMQISYTAYTLFREITEYVNAKAAEGTSRGISELLVVFKLLDDGEPTNAKLWWMENVLNWDFSRLSVWGSEDTSFYIPLAELYKIDRVMDCDKTCRGYGTRRVATVDIFFKSLDSIEEELNNRGSNECRFCNRNPTAYYRFINGAPLPFIVLDVGEQQYPKRAVNLQNFYQILNVQYKVFAYSYGTGGHFITRFPKGNVEYEYCGLTARRNSKLVRFFNRAAAILNTIILIPADLDY